MFRKLIDWFFRPRLKPELIERAMYAPVDGMYLIYFPEWDQPKTVYRQAGQEILTVKRGKA